MVEMKEKEMEAESKSKNHVMFLSHDKIYIIVTASHT